MRLSSISSQDSGFTSQDTLFLRPGSPGSGSGRLKTPEGESEGDTGTPSGGSTPSWGGGMVQGPLVPPMTDRPHTISTAYEKGHSRPSLQPYTFAPPHQNNNGTIPEESEEGASRQRVSPAESYYKIIKILTEIKGCCICLFINFALNLPDFSWQDGFVIV